MTIKCHRMSTLDANDKAHGFVISKILLLIRIMTFHLLVNEMNIDNDKYVLVL